MHIVNGSLQLCHTSCALMDAGLLVTWLGLIRAWMDTNPQAVVTLLLVNSDHQPAAAYGRVFEEAGLAKYGYAPTQKAQQAQAQSGNFGAAAAAATPAASSGGIRWPTLQAMIAANTRLVTFIASITPDPTCPYLLNEFEYIFETPYMITSLTQFSNCSLDRPPSAGSAAAALRTGMLPLMNHFAYARVSNSIQIPDVSDIDITNSPDTTATGGGGNTVTVSGTLGSQARLCTNQWGGTKPTFILVDFFNRGPAIATADSLNGLATTTGRTVSQEMLPPAARRSAAAAAMVPTASARYAIQIAAALVAWRTLGLMGGALA